MDLSRRIAEPLAKQPIGVFDSGLGGLKVLKSFFVFCPHEDFIYLGDTARLPYGTKSKGTVTQYVKKAIHFFEKNHCKAVVLACNTACALSFSEVEKETNLPIFSILEAGVEASLEASSKKNILVLATHSTVRSEAYLKTFFKKDASVKVKQLACPLLVPLAEEGWFDHPLTFQVIQEYLLKVETFDSDVVLLGCTHYPLLLPSFEKQAKLSHQKLIHGGKKLAEALLKKVPIQGSSHSGSLRLFATDISDFQEKILKQSLGSINSSFELIDI